MSLRFLSGVTLALCVAASPAAALTGAFYRQVRAIGLGAPDRWDYVKFDPTSGRVFVAHGDRVTVVDGRSGARLGEVTGIPGGTHGIGISTANGRGYTDDGRAGQAVAFNLKALKSTGTLAAAPDADGIAVDALTGRVVTINGDSGSATVIDPEANRVVATVKVGGGLEFGVADDAGTLYIDGAANREIVRVDLRANAVTARWPIPQCERPHGLAIDTANRRLFASCVNQKLLVVNADTGAVVAALPIGKGTDAAAFDPVRHRVFSSNGADGTITVIQQSGPDRYAVLDTVKTQVTARTMALDPHSGRLYVVAADAGPPAAPGGRPKVIPGSLKLFFLDPAK